MIINSLDAKLIAFYLPQFHPIEENNEWWGKGFTEWTNVTRTRPRFDGHYQPHLPADLGFYDLRLPEVRYAQADLARQYGIFGFCYYHYWFHGRRLLQRPFDEVLRSGEPDFPFCLCWANENWTRGWDGQDHLTLIAQTYSAEDDLAHIRSLLPAFADKRYIRVAGKPLFIVYRANCLPDARATADRWRTEAMRQGIGDLFLCRMEHRPDEVGDPTNIGFDAAVKFQPHWSLIRQRILRSKWWYRARRLKLVESYDAFDVNMIFDYQDYVERAIHQPGASYARYSCVFPGWDNSARREQGARIVINSSPAVYKKWLAASIEGSKSVGGAPPFVFINAWNEWAEGAHLEPCQQWGHAYLEATRDVLSTARLVELGEGLGAGGAFQAPSRPS